MAGTLRGPVTPAKSGGSRARPEGARPFVHAIGSIRPTDYGCDPDVSGRIAARSRIGEPMTVKEMNGGK
jgi:hypothetical protein